MRKAVLFIAMSLDGYIADKNGQVEWLSGQDAAAETPDAYSEFIKKIDTVIMGGTTYRQVTEELSPLEWPYNELASYIITHRKGYTPKGKNILFVQENPGSLLLSLKQKPGKDIWICGGADIVHQLMRDSLIDMFHISIIPVILGSGIRLFGPLDFPQELKLTRTRTYNGITELIYEKRYLKE